MTTTTLTSGPGLTLSASQLKTSAGMDSTNPPTAVFTVVDDAGWSKQFTQPITVTPVPWVPVNTLAQAYKARVDALGGGNPRRWGKGLDAFYTYAQASTWWAKLDGLVIGQFSRGTTLLDLKRNVALVDQAALTWVANQGFTGGNGVAISTGFNPSTAGGAFTQNSAHMGVWQLSSLEDYSVMGNSKAQMASFAAATSTLTYGLNSASRSDQYSGGSISAPPSNDTHIVLVRSASNVQQMYADGEPYGPVVTDVSVAPASENITIAGNAGAGLYPAIASRVFHWGGALTATEVTDLHWSLFALMDTAYGISFWRVLDNTFNGGSHWMQGYRMVAQNAGKNWSFSRRGPYERYETRDGEGASFDAGLPKERSEVVEVTYSPAISVTGTVNAAAKTITLSGTPRTGDIMTVVYTPAGGWTGVLSGNFTADQASAVQQKRWDYDIQASDTLTTIAAALAALVNPTYACTSSGAVITASGVPSTASGVLKFFSGSGMTLWASYWFKADPSPIGASNTSSFGPIMGQWHQSDAQSGEAASPPILFLMNGDTFGLTVDTCRYTPVKYSSYSAVLWRSSVNLRDGQWHRVVLKYRDGAGLDTTIPSGYAGPSIYGPNYNGNQPDFPTGSGKGAITLWIDGTQVCNYTNIATGFLEYTPPYWKRGIYRGSDHVAGDTFSVTYCNMEWGLTDLSSRVTSPLLRPYTV